mgnify:CR=1 FL=1
MLEFEEESYSRIGVMPHYGDADSVIWFYVEPFCTFHLVNCFEEGHEVGMYVISKYFYRSTLVRHRSTAILNYSKCVFKGSSISNS